MGVPNTGMISKQQNNKKPAQGFGRLFSVLLAFAALLVPSMAMASGGENVHLQFSPSDMYFLYASLLFGVIAIATGFYYRAKVTAVDPGDEKMQEVGKAIRDGALAYLQTQGKTIVMFVALLGAGLFALYLPKFQATIAGLLVVCFILGVAASYFAGYLGMDMAVKANMRTAASALTSYKKATEVAFHAGAVAGMLTVGMGLIGATLIFLFFPADAMKLLIGFGFGGSLAALFMRVGGGIYTKAADVGADLVGKVEAGIPEDDERNPAVIADNVGDNVGDCAGMAADVFESYEVTLVAAIVLGAATAAIFPTSIWMKLILFALMARGVGVIASIFGIAMVKGTDDVNADPLKPIQKGFKASALAAAVMTAVLAFLMMGGMPSMSPEIDATSLTSIQKYQRAEQGPIRSVQSELATKLADVKTEINTIMVDIAKKSYKGDTKLVTADDVMKDSRTAGLMGKFGFKTLAASAVKGTETPEQKEQFFTPEEFKTAVVAGMVGKEVKAGDKAVANVQDVTKELVAEDPRIIQMAKDQDMAIDQFRESVVSGAVSIDPSTPQPELPKMDGYAKLDWNDPRIKDYTVAAQSGFGAPPTMDSFVAKYKNPKPEDEFIVYKLKITQTPAATGPEKPKAMSQTIYYGPIAKKAADDQIDQAVKQQGANLKVERLAVFPTEFLINKDGKLALGVMTKSKAKVAGVVEQGSIAMTNPQRISGFSGLQFYKESKAVVEASQANPASAVRPQSADFGVVETKVAEWWKFFACIFFGILMAFAFEQLTDYYVSTHRKPTQEVAQVASAGPAPMIIQGFALGAESSVFSVFAIVISLMVPIWIFPPAEYGGYVLSFYGIALVGLGLLTTTGYILAMDTFGPISDNAQGVFEMSGAGHSHPEAALAVQRLDAAGNTTKALTKGFAIATAVVAAVALFHSYIEAAMLANSGMPLELPHIFIGLLIGGAAPFLFCAFLINAVGRASFELIGEVRRQFANDPGIMKRESKPDYGACVAIVTRAAQRELIGPGILAIALPLLVVFGLAIGGEVVNVGGHDYNLAGAQALGGFLAGTILSGQLMAVLLANSGGIWDNAKKIIEDGMHGGKGTEAHKAGVVCDTVGDPFKDTAGPALNPLIKVMNLIALLLAPYVIFPGNDTVRYIGAVVALIALYFAFMVSKKGSLATGMASVAAEGEAK